MKSDSLSKHRRLLGRLGSAILLITVATGCVPNGDTAIEMARKEAHEQGRVQGVEEGKEIGWKEANRVVYPKGYERGVKDGEAKSQQLAFDQGVSVGYSEGTGVAFENALLPTTGALMAVFVFTTLYAVLHRPLQRRLAELDAMLQAAFERRTAQARLLQHGQEERNVIMLRAAQHVREVQQSAQTMLASELARAELDQIKAEVELRLLPIYLHALTEDARTRQQALAQISETSLAPGARRELYGSLVQERPDNHEKLKNV